jgi:hypothetical protein
VKNVACESKTIPYRGQKYHPRCKVLEELLLKTCLWISLRRHQPEDANVYWCLSEPSQDGWKVWEVARCLLKKIIPQFRIPVSIGSDNGLAYMAEVV